MALFVALFLTLLAVFVPCLFVALPVVLLPLFVVAEELSCLRIPGLILRLLLHLLAELFGVALIFGALVGAASPVFVLLLIACAFPGLLIAAPLVLSFLPWLLSAVLGILRLSLLRSAALLRLPLLVLRVLWLSLGVSLRLLALLCALLTLLVALLSIGFLTPSGLGLPLVL